MWVLILVAAIGLWNFVERKSSPAVTISLTDFVNRIENGNVAEVTIKGENLIGRLQPGNEEFRATMLPGYTAVFEKLINAKVKVTVIPEDHSWFTSLMSWFMPMLVAFGFGWL